MIQGHTIDALMDPKFAHGELFGVWTKVRGLTSVMFLFAAGASLATAQSRTAKSPHRRHRAWVLIALGYLLHLPAGDLLVGHWSGALAHGTVVDILQCMGVLILALDSFPKARIGIVVVSLTAPLLAIWFSSLPVSMPFGIIANFVNTNGGSVFPLVPWSVYLALGWMWAQEDLFVAKMFTLLFSLLPISLSLFASSVRMLPPVSSMWWRLIALFLIVVGIMRATRRINALPKIFESLASETLILYAFHVLILYGAGMGLRDYFGKHLTPVEAAVAALVMLVVSSGVALTWHTLKDRKIVSKLL